MINSQVGCRTLSTTKCSGSRARPTNGCLCASCLAACLLLLVFLSKVGYSKYVAISCKWRAASGPNHCLAQVTAMLFSHMLGHMLGCCLLLMLGLSCKIYICPSVLALSTACLSRRTAVLTMVLILWARFLSEATRTFWTYRQRSSEGAPAAVAISHSVLLWICWLLLVTILSAFVAILVTLHGCHVYRKASICELSVSVRMIAYSALCL